VPRHVIQHLGHVLAEPGHPFAAVGAGAGTVIARLMHDVLARQMIRQRTALCLVFICSNPFLRAHVLQLDITDIGSGGEPGVRRC
jgi:hypothetical protein